MKNLPGASVEAWANPERMAVKGSKSLVFFIGDKESWRTLGPARVRRRETSDTGKLSKE